MSEVARAILYQLGSQRFVAMTGAKQICLGNRSLSFRLPGGGGFCRDGINIVRINLTDRDDYDVDFLRARGCKFTVVSQARGVYAENLREVFESATGLRTSL